MAVTTKDLRVIEGGLIDVLAWSTNRRARNWCATITANPNAPGGMNRRFWIPGRGEMFRYVIPEDLRQFDVIEFGADVMTWGGDRRPERAYAIVLRKGQTKLTLAVADGSLEAFLLASELKARAEALAKEETVEVEVVSAPEDSNDEDKK